MSERITALIAIFLIAVPFAAAADRQRPAARTQPAVEIVRVSTAGRFHWSDAAIGAAGGVGITIAGLGVLLLSRQTRGIPDKEV